MTRTAIGAVGCRTSDHPFHDGTFEILERLHPSRASPARVGNVEIQEHDHAGFCIDAGQDNDAGPKQRRSGDNLGERCFSLEVARFQFAVGEECSTEHVLPRGDCRQFRNLARLDSRLKERRGCV